MFAEGISTFELQLSWLNKDWSSIITQTQLHMNLLEPFIAFRRVLLQILGCEECTMQHLLQSASLLRKVCTISLVLECNGQHIIVTLLLFSGIKVF